MKRPVFMNGKKRCHIFFHPDFTVGVGIAPTQLALADCHRRSGIKPCPEDFYFQPYYSIKTSFVKQKAYYCSSRDLNDAIACLIAPIESGLTRARSLGSRPIKYSMVKVPASWRAKLSPSSLLAFSSLPFATWLMKNS